MQNGLYARFSQPANTNEEQDGSGIPTTHPELNRETAFYEGGTDQVAQLGENKVEEQQENITFGDTQPAAPLVPEMKADPTRWMRDDEIAHLGDYLSRPVLINTYTWPQSEGGTYVNAFLPWHLFFNDPRINKKLINFARLQCTLHLKFILNASPFYYGMLKVNYDPLASGRADSASVLTISQMPGPYILPQEMSSVEMTLPFFWPRDYLDICSAADFQSMGKIFYSVFDTLASANGATGSITISCYAWAEDVHLAAPTSVNALQGPVAKVAEKVSKVASAVASVPPLAGVASAVSTGAGMVSSLATALGFSNEPNMKPVSAVQVKTTHAFANTEQSVPLDKLTLDPDNAVTLDPSTTGLSNVDELAISEFCAHESLVASTNWTNDLTSGTHLASLFVTPCLQEATTYSSPARSRYAMVPMRYVSRHFRFWRGSIIYRIKIVASKYHKGRIQVSWDPEDDASTATDTETTNITKIIDLDNECELELIVPFKGVRTWNKTDYYNQEGMPVKILSGSYTKIPSRAEHNGAISIFVQNQLSAPIDVSPVRIFIFARAGPDFEVAGPLQNVRQYTPNAVQGPVALDGSTLPDETTITSFTTGERMASIRQLIHRTVCYCLYPRSVKLVPIPSTRGIWSTSAIFPLVPRSFGFDNKAGFYFTRGLVSTSNWFRCNTVYETPLADFINCFAGYRGGINWHVLPLQEDANDIPLLSITRETETHLLHSVDTVEPIAQILPLNMNQNFIDQAYPQNAATEYVKNFAGPSGRKLTAVAGNGGMSVANTSIQPFVSASIPQYNNVRFLPAWEPVRNVISGEDTFDNVRIDSVQIAGLSNHRYSNLYVSAANDFNLFYFVCCPVLWSYDLPAGGT